MGMEWLDLLNDSELLLDASRGDICGSWTWSALR